jgi:hypothetical protein
MNIRRAAVLLFTTALLLAAPMPDEGGHPRNFGIGGKEGNVPEDPREFRGRDPSEFPQWKVSRELPNDCFTFARLRYGSHGSYRRGKWLTDYPDSDVNFSFRLQQMTSLQVNPKGAIVDIDPEQLRHYPFVYMLEVGEMEVTDDEARILREYMMNGGFIMVDDFWGVYEWAGFYRAFKKIFPDREFVELPIEHEIFHTIFDLKKKPQMPAIDYAVTAHRYGEYLSYEPNKPGSEEVHYRGVFDDKGRMVMIICWNTDLGDGWEREGEDPWYFHEFSEKQAYPMGINIIFYAMTH